MKAAVATASNASKRTRKTAVLDFPEECYGSIDDFIFNGREMHRIFTISEICLLICGFCGDPELSRLARTAKTFECALDVLWREICDISQLVRCFPPDLWTSKKMYFGYPNDPIQVVSFVRSIRPSDWTRFFFYSARIRSLTLFTRTVHHDAVEHLRVAAPPSGLCPNLKQLVLTGHRDFGCISSFLRGGLQSFSFTPDSESRLSPNLACSFLPTLWQHSPEITSLELQHYDSLVVYIIPDLLRTLPRLTNLTLYKLSTKNIPDVIALPHLRMLQIGRLLDYYTPNVTPTPYNVSCEGLESIVIGHKSNVAFVSQLIDSLPICSLKEIRLSIGGSPSSEDLTSLLETVAQNCDARTLKHFEVQYKDSYETVESDPELRRITIPGQNLAILTKAFSHLTTLNLSLAGGLVLDDNIIEQMACSWPHIVTLDISCNRIAPFHFPKVTIHGLTKVAEHCPGIETLCVYFDAANVPMVRRTNKLGRGLSNTSLRQLGVGFSPVRSTSNVAAQLSSIFPNIRAISTIETTVPILSTQHLTQMRRWRNVRRLIRAFADVRQQEQRFWLKVPEKSSTDLDNLEVLSDSSEESGCNSDASAEA